MRKVTCPVCKNSMAEEFFNPGPQPLATLGWPKSSEDAKKMNKFPMDYVQCPECTHVWNASFSYDSNGSYSNDFVWGASKNMNFDLSLFY